MRLPHHLVRSSGGIFHFRQKVPSDLHQSIGRRVIKISLRTRNSRLALIYAYELSLRYAQAFAEHRGVPMPKPPSIKDIQGSYQRGEAKQYGVDFNPTTGNVSLRTDGTPQDHADAMTALENIGRIFPNMIVRVPAQPTLPIEPPTEKPAAVSPTLRQAMVRYEKTVAPSMNQNTWRQRQRSFKSFVTFIGPDTPIASITRAQAGEWADSLITGARVKRTAVNMVSHVAQLFEPLVDRGVFVGGVNPVKGLLVLSNSEKRARRQSGHRIEAFSLDDLKRLFDPENFRKIGTAHTRWAAVIGLYSGARVGEVAQIYLRDFTEQSGMLCLKIAADSEEQGIKTDAERLIPVHPDLVRLGLLERIEQLKSSGAKRFFPDIRLDSNAGKGNAISKGFREYRDHLELKPNHPNGTVSFHSLRKNVTQELQGTMLPAERRRALLGHEPGMDVHTIEYMRPWKPEEFALFIPGLTWGQWLDFDGLKPLLLYA